MSNTYGRGNTIFPITEVLKFACAEHGELQCFRDSDVGKLMGVCISFSINMMAVDPAGVGACYLTVSVETWISSVILGL